MRIKQVKPVRSHKIIFESQTGNPCTLSTHIPYLKVKPNRSVRFHLSSNISAEVKPGTLVHFHVDSFWKPGRTNGQASAQLPRSEAKPDKPIHFHIKPLPRVKRATPVHSQFESP